MQGKGANPWVKSTNILLMHGMDVVDDRNKTNHPSSHTSATANKAIHSLQMGNGFILALFIYRGLRR